MQIWHGLGDVPADARTLVTIGNFDGVHAGHRRLLAEMVASAQARGLTSVVMTFDPHPARVHRPASAPPLLTLMPRRLDLLAGTGLDAVLLVDYVPEFYRQTPREFVENYLVHGLHAAEVLAGRDTKFGRDNAGDIATLQELGAELGFDVRVAEDVLGLPDRRWSSSWARELVAAGDVAAAARVLGRPHAVSGVVVHGFKRGRDLGFPTANLQHHPDGMVPADGIYAGWLVRASGERLPAAISIGTNPTFDGTERTVEAHVPGRDDLNLYDETVTLEFVDWLRPTLKFDSVDELVTQVHRDNAEALARLA